MPRQPYKFSKEGKLEIRWGAAFLDERPALAPLVGRCLLTWPQVEYLLAAFLGLLLKTDSHAAMSVFATLRRSSNRAEAITAAAEHLPSREREVCLAVLKVVQSAEAERNSLMHGMLGTTADRPNDLIWTESSNLSSVVVDDLFRRVGSRVDFFDKLFVYTEDDLRKIEEQIHTAAVMLQQTMFYIRLTYHLPPSDRRVQEQYDQLCNEAPMKEALHALRARAHQNSLPKPPRS
jgi:hypothetical protein